MIHFLRHVTSNRITITSYIRVKFKVTKKYLFLLNHLSTKNNNNAIALPPDITFQLYQYNICPFCSKVKAVLEYMNIEYQKVEVNPLSKSELNWSNEYKKMPVAKYNSLPIYGSDEIIYTLLKQPILTQTLQKKWLSSNMTLDIFQRTQSAIQWSNYSNEIATYLYPNLCKTFMNSFNAFAYVHNVNSFTWIQKQSIQWTGSLAMFLSAKNIKRKYDISDEKNTLQQALEKFIKEGLKNGKYQYCSGVNIPNLGDLNMFGTIHSIQNTSLFVEMIQDSENDHLKIWYKNLSKEVGEKVNF